MGIKQITRAQRKLLAERLAQLPSEKKAIFRSTLQGEGIDPWQLPIIPAADTSVSQALSFSQQRLWFIDQLEPGNTMYNLFFALKFSGNLQVKIFQQSLNDIVFKHHVLRTNYINVDGKGQQKIHAFEAFSIPVVELPTANSEDILQKLMRDEANTSFDLATDPKMLRVTLVHRQGYDDYIGLFTFHHIAFDALSSAAFIQELNQFYKKHLSPEKSQSIDMDSGDTHLQYADYAVWQREWSQSQAYQNQVEYWQQQLNGIPTSLDLATTYRRPAKMTYVGDKIGIELSGELSRKIVLLTEQCGATLYMVMLAALNILLSRYSNQNDICVGTSVANRPRSELENIIGFFVNTLVMRNQVNANLSFKQFLDTVKSVATDAVTHQDLPFDQLIDLLNIERKDNITPIFQVFFVLNNALDNLSLQLDEVDVSIFDTPLYHARFDLTLRITEGSLDSGNEKIKCDIEYNTNLFSQKMINQMLDHYREVLEQIVADMNTPLKQLHLGDTGDYCKSLMDSQELQRKKVIKIHDTIGSHEEHDVYNDASYNVIRQFEHSAAEYPHKEAIVCRQQSLNYRDLNIQANRLAHFLQSQGVTSAQRVGILLDRSPNFIVSILAVLKIGAAYVPLDNKWPEQRLTKIIKDSDLLLLLSEQQWKSTIPNFQGQWVLFDDANSLHHEGATNNLLTPIKHDHSAYLIYTSGSTGEPKGVVINHGNLSHYINGIDSRFDIAGCSFGLISTIAADLGNTSIYGALCFGGTLHVLPSNLANDAGELSHYCEQHSIDILKIVPSHLQGLLSALEVTQAKALLPQQCLIVGGEACPTALVEQVHALSPHCRVVNHYGPTETTIGALAYEYRGVEKLPGTLLNNNLPIGYPLPGNRIYIVDQYQQLCPTGVPGELLISGSGVALGYHNREALTEERFVVNPFMVETLPSSKSIHAKMANFLTCYRTGDRVRRLESGEIEFLGRMDEQVKIRGYRVELGEIEVALCDTAGIQQAAVVTTQSAAGQDQLAAYLVLAENVSSSDIKKQLECKLPDYMLPQWLLPINKLPLTNNGKLDRNSLPSPQSFFENTPSHKANQEPLNNQEQLLADIWCQVLRIENVKANDNFFELGGDSILSLQVISRAKKAGLKLTPKQLFEAKTLTALATIAKEDKPANGQPQPQIQALDTSLFGLTPIQQWFFDAEHPQQHHWNQSAMFKVLVPLDFIALQAAAKALIKHHDALRLRFTQKTSKGGSGIASGNQPSNANWMQYYSADISHNICEHLTISQDENWEALLEFQATQLQKNLNIFNGPLIRVAYFDSESCHSQSVRDRAEKRESYLLIAIHHLVVDGVSWRILLADFQRAYQQALAYKTMHNSKTPSECASTIDLGDKSTTYRQWVEQLNDYAQSQTLAQQADYWCQNQRVGDFPVQYPGGNNTVGSTQSVKCTLSLSLTKHLLKSVPAVYRTQITDILLAALSRQVSVHCDSPWVLLELEGHGREDINEHLDLSQTFGWFTTRYPVYLQLEEGKEQGEYDSASLIKSIKEQLRQVPDNGLSFGLLRYLNTHQHSRSLNQLKQRQQAPISFNYLGQFDLAIDEQSLLTPSDIRCGEERDARGRRDYLIDINAFIRNDQLHIEWHYSNQLHSADWVNAFAQEYVDSLTHLINDCLADKAGGGTPSDFPLTQLQQPHLDALTLPWANVESVYPLTPMQEGLLFHTLMNPKTGIYFMQYRYELNGAFDHQIFTQAWQRVVDRHEVLRTAFLRHQEQALQVVYRDVPPPVTILDWQDLSASQQTAKLKQLMSEQLKEGFDLTKPTQMSITLIQIAAEKYQLIRSFHHILTDAWCFSLIMMDFLSFYHAIKKGETLQLPKPRPFQDYIAWLQQQDIQAAEGYWRKTLSGFQAPTALAIDRPQPVSGVEDVLVRLSTTETHALDKLARQLQVTLNTFVQGAWGLLLSRYSGDSDIIFGVTVAGRPTDLEGADTTVGLFINTLPLRLQVSAQASVKEYLTAIFERNLAMREYEFAPLVDIQRWSDIPPGEALFNSLFVYENAPIDPEMYRQLSMFELEDMTTRTHTNYPITVVVLPEENLGLQISYDKELFDQDSINRMLSHFKCLLLNLGEAARQELLIQPTATSDNLDRSVEPNNSSTQVTLHDIELLSTEEQHQHLIRWNQTHTTYPREQCWPELFRQQVQKTPNATAVVCKHQQLSYQALYDQVQCLARGLLEAGVQANDVVAIFDERDIDLLVMIISVLTAGAAYLPLDPAHPEKRLASIIELSQPKAIIGRQQTLPKLESAINQILEGEGTLQATPQLLAIEAIRERITDTSSVAEAFALTYDPQHLAYVIYTSGSTGVPKGAMIEHLGMLNNLYSKIPTLSLTCEDAVAQTASQCFDISVWQFLTVLLCGARVHIYPDDVAHHPAELLKAIERDQVTILESVPSLIQGFLDAEPALSTLRWLMPTGEALSSDLAQRWLSAYPSIPLMNAYGPAECADDVALWPLRTLADAVADPIPIGRPLDNNRLYVLDNLQRLQPVGVAGELYVAGAGVGRGYLNDPQRTEAAFVDNVLLTHPQHKKACIEPLDNPERLYRTGDLARWRSDGVLEYLGRTDHQVKIRGFRIELGEIEACLASHQSVRHAAVVVRQDPRGDNCLVAYYQHQKFSDNDASSDSDEIETTESLEHALKLAVKASLPEYMLPNRFISLVTMPLNSNGKIDRHSLPEPDFNDSDKTIAEPHTDIERKLVTLWQEVLKIDQVDIHASFFALGGHSLLAAQLHARVCQHFGIELPLRTLFEYNSVAEIAEQIEQRFTAQSLMTNEQADDELMEALEL